MFRHVSAIAIALLTVLALGSCSGASSTNRQTTPPQQDSQASQATGSPEATAYPSPADASPSSGSALSAKLLTGPVSGVELQEIDRIMLPHDIENIFGHCGDCEVDPPECLTTGLGSPEVASQAKAKSHPPRSCWAPTRPPPENTGSTRRGAPPPAEPSVQRPSP